ncbi:hypothetical protein M758_9G126800 [Ceratodon purpureus]|nr:hypothetical protein M758_9G126800 [Ceratodon purpureus]
MENDTICTSAISILIDHQRRIPPLNPHQVLHKTRDLTHRLELKYYAWRAIVL